MAASSASVRTGPKRGSERIGTIEMFARGIGGQLPASTAGLDSAIA